MSNPAALCTHIKANGITCGSPAVSGTALCYHHTAVKAALGKIQQAPIGVATPIPFVFPEDRASMQINYFLLLQAFNEQRIDLRTYNAFLGLLRAMARNLGKSGSLAENSEREDSDQRTAVSDQENSDQRLAVSEREDSDQRTAVSDQENSDQRLAVSEQEDSAQQVRKPGSENQGPQSAVSERADAACSAVHESKPNGKVADPLNVGHQRKMAVS